MAFVKVITAKRNFVLYNGYRFKVYLLEISLMNYSLRIATLLGVVSLSLGASATDTSLESPSQWYADGQDALKKALNSQPILTEAKNIILFIGDGMGVSTVTAARIFEAQQRDNGESGEENYLSFENMPWLGLSKTYNTNQQTPDSAGTITAIMTGVKTKAGMINVNQHTILGDCASSVGNHLPTIMEQTAAAGRSTGIVTTARLTHATPAGAYAHTPHRNWESDKDLLSYPSSAGCIDIASQLLAFNYGAGIQVALGGGRDKFLPVENSGERLDGRDLTEEWLSKYDRSAYVDDRDSFDKIAPPEIDHLLGIFNSGHMGYEADRLQNDKYEPSLAAMTDKAIDILAKNKGGYFLMVEAGRIDSAHHAGNAYRALQDTVALSNAVRIALEKTDPEDTLIIVTADHSHVFTIAGYPTRGNPILGKVIGNDDSGDPSQSLAEDFHGQPYTTVGYANGWGYNEHILPEDRESNIASGIAKKLGFKHLEAIDKSEPPAIYRQDSRPDLLVVDTGHRNFHQESLITLESETHGGEDVAIYARGPYAHLFAKTEEQNFIYHVMKWAAGYRVAQKD